MKSIIRMTVTLAAAVFLLAVVETLALAEQTPAIAKGPFNASWESLKQYQCPEWFRDAKFGIWACWGPITVPEFDQWYSRNMYIEDSRAYRHHVATYGHPSKFGFKDLIPLWKGEKWDPDRMVGLFKQAGAKYFTCIATFHDNFDMFDSKYQEWNSVRMGPRKDVVGAWKKAADKYGLRFGVTEHLARAYSWFQVSHGADKKGPYASVPYDGADPKYQDLYCPTHGDTYDAYPKNPSEAWQHEWFNRMKDLLDKYQPDLFYTDGGIPFGEVGRALMAHYYNANISRHGGKLEAVYNIKKWPSGIAGDYRDGVAVLDRERGVQDDITALPWQTDTCIGNWFYEKGVKYKSPDTIIDMLVDIVSKNGNLLLNFPVRADGSLDDEEIKILKEIGRWMTLNGEAIYSTRPWKIYGESPAKLKAGDNFNEDVMRFTAADVRFTTKGGKLYAIGLDWPQKEWSIKALGTAAGLCPQKIAGIRLLGCKEEIKWSREAECLKITRPDAKPCEYAYAFVITFEK